jgi:hypothetical protein
LAVFLVVPEGADDWPHIPRGDRFREQRLIERGQMVALAVVEQLVQLLGRHAREPLAEDRGHIVR